LILKGLTAVYCFGAFGPRIAYGARFRKRALQPHTKEKCGNLVAAARDFAWLFPRMIIANFGLGSREKEREEDNAETQRALRFAK
jgi:hypothetical protein